MLLRLCFKPAFSDYEVILIDDGSKDNSGRICDDYAKRNPGVLGIPKRHKTLVNNPQL